MNGSSQRAARVRHPSDKLVEHVAKRPLPFRRRRQREWGEVYVKGLHYCGKEIHTQYRQQRGDVFRRAESAPFHYQLTGLERGRRELARYADNAVAPVAWVVDPLVIQKAGEHSVGVRRTFVPGLGKTVQRQYVLGLDRFRESKRACGMAYGPPTSGPAANPAAKSAHPAKPARRAATACGKRSKNSPGGGCGSVPWSWTPGATRCRSSGNSPPACPFLLRIRKTPARRPRIRTVHGRRAAR